MQGALWHCNDCRAHHLTPLFSKAGGCCHIRQIRMSCTPLHNFRINLTFCPKLVSLDYKGIQPGMAAQPMRTRYLSGLLLSVTACVVFSPCPVPNFIGECLIPTACLLFFALYSFKERSGKENRLNRWDIRRALQPLHCLPLHADLCFFASRLTCP